MSNWHPKTQKQLCDIIRNQNQSENVLNVPTKILSKCLVLSICIEDYTSVLKKNQRKGCDVDIKNINDTFGDKGYSYKIIQNQSKAVSLTAYTKLINQTKTEIFENSDKYDGFVFVFSGHGTSHPNHPYSSVICLSPENGQKYSDKIPVSHILDEFRNGHKGLAKAFLGKPRIYIIQACRGGDVPEPIEQKQNDEQYDGGQDQIKYNKYHPDDDMILIQSNTQNYKSYRNTQTGSHLITAMSKVLGDNKLNGKEIVLDDAIYVIKEKVKQLSESKQACVSTSTLRYKVAITKRTPIFTAFLNTGHATPVRKRFSADFSCKKTTFD
eukprot:376080_1